MAQDRSSTASSKVIKGPRLSQAERLVERYTWCEHIKSAALRSTSSAAAQETHGSRGTFLLFRSEGDDARALMRNKDIHSGTHSKLCPSTMHRAASEGTHSCEVLDAAWIVRCMHKQFHIIIAPYILDGTDSEGMAARGKKVHGKCHASQSLLLSSPAARTLKCACLCLLHDCGDGAKREESMLAAKSCLLQSKQHMCG